MHVTISFAPNTSADYALLRNVLEQLQNSSPARGSSEPSSPEPVQHRIDPVDDAAAATAQLLAEAKAGKTRRPRTPPAPEPVVDTQAVMQQAKEFVQSARGARQAVVAQLSPHAASEHTQAPEVADTVVTNAVQTATTPAPNAGAQDLFADLLGDPKPQPPDPYAELSYEDLVNRIKAHIRTAVTPSQGISIMQDIFREYKVNGINDLSVTQLRAVANKIQA